MINRMEMETKKCMKQETNRMNNGKQKQPRLNKRRNKHERKKNKEKRMACETAK